MVLLAVLVVGVLAGYYFGTRAGVASAAVALLLFVVAAFLPGAKLLAYVLVGGGLAGICLAGPKRRPDAPGPAALWKQAKRAWTTLTTLRKK